MADYYKKMMNATIEDSINELCLPYCEPERNQLGFCPTACIPFCYPICNRPFLNVIPPIPTEIVTKTTDHPTPTNQNVNAPHYAFFPLFFLAMIAIGVLILLCYVFSKFTKYWIDSRREETEEEEEQDQEVQEIGPPVSFLDQELQPEVDNRISNIIGEGLQPSIINSISTLKFKKDGDFIEGTECSVCLNNFQEDEDLRVLPNCSHAFHVPCIDAWLKAHTNCPMCRTGIVFSPLPELPSSSPEKQNIGGDLEELRNQEYAGIETGEVEFQEKCEDVSVELPRKE